MQGERYRTDALIFLISIERTFGNKHAALMRATFRARQKCVDHFRRGNPIFTCLRAPARAYFSRVSHNKLSDFSYTLTASYVHFQLVRAGRKS